MTCDPSNRNRRSTRSATTPPIKENRKIGISPRKASSPSMNADLESSNTSQLWASFCIHVPILDVHAPNHMMRKLAQSWLVFELSKSAFMLGLDAFLGEIPI